ncbi:sensor histidine kinase [Gordonia sp. NPDC003425]
MLSTSVFRLADSTSAVARTRRYYGLFAGVAYSVFLPFLLPAVAQARAISAPWWTPAALICAALPGFVVGIHSLFSSKAALLRVWARLAALGVLVAAALWWPAWDGRPLDNATVFWLGPFVVLGSICAMIAWAPNAAALYLITAAVTIKVTGDVAQGVSSPVTMITDAACSAAFAVVPFALGVSGLRTAAALDRTSATEITLAEHSAAARARSAERAFARALTHDEIMSNLLEAARNPGSAGLPDRAAATVAAMDSTLREATVDMDPDAAGVGAAIADAVRHNDPTMVFSSAAGDRHGQTFPSSAVTALASATGEAARNCFRHVPRDCRRSCHVVVDDHRIEVTVADEGPGFDRSATPRERLGLSMSIEERMRQVPGGDASIASVPGSGTTLTLTWHKPDESVPVDATDPLGLRSPTARLLAALIVATMGFAAALGPAQKPWWVPVVVIGVLAVSAAILVTGRTDRPGRVGSLIVAATPACMCAVYLFAPGHVEIVPLWVTGPPALVVSILAMRRRPVLAVAGFAATLVVVGTWSSVEVGDVVPGILLIGPSGGIVAISIVFANVNRTLARNLVESRRRATEAAGMAAAARAATQERARELEPVTALARPLLLHLASGAPVDPATRTECALTESRLRDLLRSRALCTPDVDSAVERARRRGVTVSLLDDRLLDRPGIDAAGPLDEDARTVIVDALERTPSGAVRVRAMPSGRPVAVTVVAETGRRCEWTGIDSTGRVRTTVTEMTEAPLR